LVSLNLSNQLGVEMGGAIGSTINVRLVQAAALSFSSQACAIDNDGDGYVAIASGGNDCDDNDPDVHPFAPELCDGKDNDCHPTPDGQDEEWFGQACDGPDADLCQEGVLTCDCGQSACNDDTADSPELCDGIDNDCDGSFDEDFALGASCLVGIGECQASGHNICSADGLGILCDAQAGAPSDELCDGKDNDCDGAIDGQFNIGAACSVGIGECVRIGQNVCSADQLSSICDAVPGLPDLEFCDGLDNDCNGLIDDKDADGDGHIDAACGGDDFNDDDPSTIDPPNGDDADQDGVEDAFDICPNTPLGVVVDRHGCSISQHCPPCGEWRNHGQFVACVSITAGIFFLLGDISVAQTGEIISTAARSDIGKPHYNGGCEDLDIDAHIGAPGWCLRIDLRAFRKHHPSSRQDGEQQLERAASIVIPHEIPVTEGNAGNHKCQLTMHDAVNDRHITCHYRGGSDQAHPSDPEQINKGLKYHFVNCDHSMQAGDSLFVDHFKLHVKNGDSHHPQTAVRLEFMENGCF